MTLSSNVMTSNSLSIKVCKEFVCLLKFTHVVAVYLRCLCSYNLEFQAKYYVVLISGREGQKEFILHTFVLLPLDPDVLG